MKNECWTIDMGGGKSAVDILNDKYPTLTTTHYGEPAVCYGCDLGTSRDVGVLWLEECSKTISNGTCPGHHNHVVYAIHEADGQDVTMMEETAYALVVGGGKPGQGYPAVMICDE